jgi:hypothetical protein
VVGLGLKREGNGAEQECGASETAGEFGHRHKL